MNCELLNDRNLPLDNELNVLVGQTASSLPLPKEEVIARTLPGAPI